METKKSFSRKGSTAAEDEVEAKAAEVAEKRKVMESRGRYKLRRDCGKHYIHENPLQEIEGKPHKRVVFPGDILLTPPRLIRNIQDKFLRLDSVTDTAEVAVRMEEERSVAHIEEKGEGEFFVYTSQGIKLNDKPLDKEAAEECLKIELEDEEERKEDDPDEDAEKDRIGGE